MAFMYRHSTFIAPARYALLLTVILFSLGVSAQEAPPNQPEAITLASSFNYQGYIERNGVPVTATCDFEFRLYDDLAAGAQIGSPLAKNAVPVSGGIFNVQLNFGAAAFAGEDRYLAVAVRCPSGITSYDALTPRQPITPVPYAIALYGLRTDQNSTSPNIIGGFNANTVTAGVVGATISGGGFGGEPNSIISSYGTVSGGSDNQAGNISSISGDYTTVSGGQSNTAAYVWDTVGGGFGNLLAGGSATISGGYGNSASASYATIGGGGRTVWFDASTGNIVTDTFGTVGGGGNNQAGDNAGFDFDSSFATVAGGNSNLASGDSATVGGGNSNTASGDSATVSGGINGTASGDYATVPGGASNTASGDYSFAAGNGAVADDQGAFVWGDSTLNFVNSYGINTFSVRASGGVRFYTNAALTAGVQLTAGSGSWASISDRNAKENLADVDTRAVLDALVSIPVSTWNYISQDDAIRHIGVMAQDFYAAFNVGEDDRHITTIDADGVAFAAIQGLNAKLEDEVETLRAENAELEARLVALEGLASNGQSASLLPFAVIVGFGLLGVALRSR
jgi:hypothetical protein